MKFGMTTNNNNKGSGETVSATEKTDLVKPNGHGEDGNSNAGSNNRPDDSNAGGNNDAVVDLTGTTNTRAGTQLAEKGAAHMSPPASPAASKAVQSMSTSPNKSDIVPPELLQVMGSGTMLNILTDKAQDDLIKVEDAVKVLKAHHQFEGMNTAIKAWLALAGYLTGENGTDIGMCSEILGDIMVMPGLGYEWVKPLGECHEVFCDGGAMYNLVSQFPGSNLKEAKVGQEMVDRGAWVQRESSSHLSDVRPQDGKEADVGNKDAEVEVVEVCKPKEGTGQVGTEDDDDDDDASDGEETKRRKGDDTSVADHQNVTNASNAVVANLSRKTDASDADAAKTTRDQGVTSWDHTGIVTKKKYQWARDEAGRNDLKSKVHYLFQNLRESEHEEAAARKMLHKLKIGIDITWNQPNDSHAQEWKDAMKQLVVEICGANTSNECANSYATDEMVDFIGETWDTHNSFKRSYTHWVQNVYNPRHQTVPPCKRPRLNTGEEGGYASTSPLTTYETYTSEKLTLVGNEPSFQAWMPQAKGRFTMPKKTKAENSIEYEDKEGDEELEILGMTLYTSDGCTEVVTTSDEVASVRKSNGYLNAASNAPPSDRNQSTSKSIDDTFEDAQEDISSLANTSPYRHVWHNFLPGLNSELKLGCIVNNPYIHNGMEPNFLPDGALVNNLRMTRDMQKCKDALCGRQQEDESGAVEESCGSKIVPGQNVYVLGEDIHIVKQNVAYIGVYLVDVWGTIRCKIGVVKCFPYQLNLFQNRHAIVMDVRYGKDDDATSAADSPRSPTRRTPRHLPVEQAMKGVAAIRFVDGNRPYINLDASASPAAPFSLTTTTAVRWGWTKEN
jgi:hypothetical protein